MNRYKYKALGFFSDNNIENTTIQDKFVKVEKQHTSLKGAHTSGPLSELDCPSCKTTFTSTSLYDAHTYQIHEKNSDDIKLRCQFCDAKYTLRSSLRSHLQKKHNLCVLYKQFIKSPNIDLDPNDPNFYCGSCKSTQSNRKTFLNHLQRVHKLQLLPRMLKKNLIETLNLT